MSEEKETVIFYRDWWEAVKELPQVQQLEVMQAVMEYAFEGKIPNDPTVRAFTALIRTTINRDFKKWKETCRRRRAAIKKRWDRVRKLEAEERAKQQREQQEGPAKQPAAAPQERVKAEEIKPQERKAPERERPVRRELEEEFERFRARYPGSKRGADVELKHLRKRWPGQWQEIVPKLNPALDRLLDYRARGKEAGVFVPSPANLMTWINNARWEDEYPEITVTEKPNSYGHDIRRDSGAGRGETPEEFRRRISEQLAGGDTGEPDISGAY